MAIFVVVVFVVVFLVMVLLIMIIFAEIVFALVVFLEVVFFCSIYETNTQRKKLCSLCFRNVTVFVQMHMFLDILEFKIENKKNI